MMPNKTIYVSDVDLPIFERAQELAGGNLSATIAQALKRYIELNETIRSEPTEIVVKVGKNTYTQKRFIGQLLAKGVYNPSDKSRRKVIEVYKTAKGKFALYIRNMPNWARDWKKSNWNESWDERSEFTLEIFESLDELKERIPEDLFNAVQLRSTGDGIETLDI
jgi:EXLDI family protein